MGHTRIAKCRRNFCYQRAQAGVPYRTIQKEDRERYGMVNGQIALGAISKIVAIGDLVGDPCFDQ